MSLKFQISTKKRNKALMPIDSESRPPTDPNQTVTVRSNRFNPQSKPKKCSISSTPSLSFSLSLTPQPPPPPPPPPSTLIAAARRSSQMRHLLSPIPSTMPPSSIITTSTNSNSTSQPQPQSTPSNSSKIQKSTNPSSLISISTGISLCRNHHSPSATLDVLILILVLFSGTFLLTSYFSYLFTSLSLLLPPISLTTVLPNSPYAALLFCVLLFFAAFTSVEICCGHRSRRCSNPNCKGLKKAMEFDLQLQTEECLKSEDVSKDLVDNLPWKGGSEANPDYECLRSELRKMAPVNGRAVLLFRGKCGCPVAKLEGWGAKRGRRHKK